jgi:hypothetical protein
MTYIFADGSFHYLRKVPTKKQSPQTPSAPEPKEDTDLLQATLSVLAELPTPPEPEITLPLVEESESMTPMQLAWRRRK